MPRIRTLGATTALVAAGVMVLSSVAAAHDGPHFGPWGFDNRWVGTDGPDEYTAPDESRDLIIGLGGDDVLRAGDRRDLVRGGDGDDKIAGGPGSDKIVGGIGEDRLHGGRQADKIVGGPGADGINGGLGRDLIMAGRGGDRIIANDGMRDRIICGPGFDSVKADRRDRVARDCERVLRVRPDTPEDSKD
jgi:Ca2+-binding RTX toxin-like protein